MTVQDWLGESNTLGCDIWERKYRYNNESFDEWLDRVSGGNEDMKNLIIEKRFLFGGRILANRGISNEGMKVTLSNCYVTETGDSIEEIFDTAKKLARTFSYGGGVGVDLTPLSPRGAKVHNAAKTTTGAVSFMDLYSLVTGLICQQGRRGALMLSLACDHPDIEEFINVKSDLNKITYANISVRMSDDFMEAVKSDSEFTLSFTRKETGEVLEKRINARELFKKLAYNNWDTGEPGLLFWDTISNWHLMSNHPDFKYAGVNPCAEQPLVGGGSCLLGSFNLSEYVLSPFTDKAKLDFDKFREDICTVISALNNVLDEGLPLHPLQEQRDTVRNWRQIGCGIFGLADMLIKMQVKYGSNEAVELCNKVMSVMADNSIKASAVLASSYGSFPNYNYEYLEKSPYYEYVTSPSTKEIVREYGLRNSQILTIPPTGTLSTMLGVSGGAEPIYANYYNRTTKSLYGEDVTYKVYTPIVKKYMESNNLYDDSKLPEYFVTAYDIDYKSRINMQSALQKYIDASISSTINVPEEFTVEQVQDLYMYAWEKNCKGITIFRDKCRRVAILTTDDKKPEEEESTELKRGDIIESNDDLLSCKRTIKSGCGKFYLHVDFDETTGDPLETFIDIGSGGGCERNLQFISRMISLALRAGVPLENIVDQAQSIRPCKAYTDRTTKVGDTSKGFSCPSAIGYALTELNEKITSRCFTCVSQECCQNEFTESGVDDKSICPECGQTLRHEGGCNVCSCGYSKCS